MDKEQDKNEIERRGGMKEFLRSVTYYDLIEIEWKDGVVGHIPVPFFYEFGNGVRFIMNIQRASIRREGDFFGCPICGARSYFAGICEYCIDDEAEEGPVKEYLARRKKIDQRKSRFMEKIREERQIPRTVKTVEYIIAGNQ